MEHNWYVFRVIHILVHCSYVELGNIRIENNNRTRTWTLFSPNEVLYFRIQDTQSVSRTLYPHHSTRPRAYVLDVFTLFILSEKSKLFANTRHYQHVYIITTSVIL